MHSYPKHRLLNLLCSNCDVQHNPSIIVRLTELMLNILVNNKSVRSIRQSKRGCQEGHAHPNLPHVKQVLSCQEANELSSLSVIQQAANKPRILGHLS